MNTNPTPPATPPCGLKPNTNRREESETPQLQHPVTGLELNNAHRVRALQPVSNITLTDPQAHRLDPVTELARYPLHRPMISTELLA